METLGDIYVLCNDFFNILTPSFSLPSFITQSFLNFIKTLPILWLHIIYGHPQNIFIEIDDQWWKEKSNSNKILLAQSNFGCHLNKIENPFFHFRKKFVFIINWNKKEISYNYANFIMNWVRGGNNFPLNRVRNEGDIIE